MASIPSSGSLMATHNYHRRRLSSTSSNSSCSSSEYSGEVIPHPPGLPKSDPGHWWASFFFGKTTHPAMTTVSESPESLGALQVPAGAMVACGLVAAPGAGRRRHASEPSSGPS
ncbi:PDPFB factor, partial [Galbula dea]|nr:PDPFB factor [Galbula dea]